MKRVALSAPFRARMRPLVLLTALVVAAAAPTAHAIRQQLDLRASARSSAAAVGEIVRDEIATRPVLWRYGSAKLGQRLAEAGLARVPLRVADAGGRAVPLDSPPAPARALWGRVEVREGGALLATVWAAEDLAPVYRATAELALVFLVLGLLLASLLYLLPARAIAAADTRIHALLARLASTLQEEDRRRMARELHDGVGQALTAARLEVQALAARVPEQREAVARVTGQLDLALDEIRRSTLALAPPALAELGLRGALERHCAAFANAAGVEVRCEVAASLPALGGELETACYRIVQEALANTGRHARARHAWVRLGPREGGGLRLSVQDDGVGLPPEGPARGQGLTSMRERASAFGAQLELAPVSPQGLEVRVDFGPAALEGEG